MNKTSKRGSVTTGHSRGEDRDVNYSGLSQKSQFATLTPAKSKKLLNNTSTKSLGGRPRGPSRKKSHQQVEAIKEKNHRRGKTMNTSPSRNILPRAIGHGNFASRVAENLEATARLHQTTYAANPPEKQKKIYSEVFSAYLTPNSLSFLSQRGITKSSVC